MGVNFKTHIVIATGIKFVQGQFTPFTNGLYVTWVKLEFDYKAKKGNMLGQM